MAVSILPNCRARVDRGGRVGTDFPGESGHFELSSGTHRQYTVSNFGRHPAATEGRVKTTLKLERHEARHMADAALRKAAEIGVAETVCIADAGGFPLLLERMDGGRVTGPQIAWNKAFTAAGHKRSTHLFTLPPNGPALPGNEAFGIQLSFEGRFAAFVGGYPVVVNGEVVGGVGLSGGNGEQDTACGVAALQALKELIGAEGYDVVVAADIKK